MTDAMKILFITLTLAAGFIGIAMLLDRASCYARWEGSGRNHEWGVMSGCRVSDKNGHLIPAANIRDMQ